MEQVDFSRRELSSQLDRIAEQSAARRTKQEQNAYYEKAAIAVIEAYARIRQLSPVVASNLDPDPVKRSEKLTYNLLDWCVDIESGTAKALVNLPELQRVWFEIAFGNPVAAGQRNEVLQRCGRIYAARGLEPWRYWRRSTR